MPSSGLNSNLASHPLVGLQGLELTLGAQSGQVNILKGIDLKINEGETIGLVGPSGSGKTSMLMVMAGLEKATAGQIHINGHDFTKLDEDELALVRRGAIGIVFQSFHLIPTMTALENVAVPLELANQSGARARAEECLNAVGLGHRMDHFPGQMSGGEQQRVALARAFAPRPKIILADEPTGNLDGTTGAQIIELLFDVSKKEGTTMLLVTHDPELAERCGRVIRMEDGRIVEDDGSSVDDAVAG